MKTLILFAMTAFPLSAFCAPKVGDTAVYRYSMQNGQDKSDGSETWTITSIDTEQKMATVNTLRDINGEQTTQTQVLDLVALQKDKFFEECMDTKSGYEHETVNVAAGTFDTCISGDGAMMPRSWYAAKVTVFGMVKSQQTANGKVEKFELKSFCSACSPQIK
ncbi:hypothetical protein B9G69_017270 [Bdellovibrio sp. SKB1291214]|uniref:hypothetical protein n=1 Tax=Bdellovibrio sp. SKB1291214 TaxID=1732569 RepID=UPI000B51A199|nr:hypothetical protein [Bdellovibrio sp. SKB1291214]UYL08796.1 hypothetical protein B9G69_017270 [Bdellovibrio sp. SKB1291214]